MTDEQRAQLRGAFPLSLTPLMGLIELQQDLLRMHLEAASEVSRHSCRMLDTHPPTVPEAPMQMMHFIGDCMKLSLSPLVLMASSRFAPAPPSPGEL